MSNLSSARSNWLSVVGVIVIPLLLVAAVIGSVWQSGSRTDGVRAAIVNNDEMVTIDGQLVPLGRQLAGKLASLEDIPAAGEEEGVNYTWVVTNTEDAEEGLRDGKYAAVVTIPENFSAAATSTAGEAAEAEQAVIDIEVSPRAGAADSTMTRTVVQAAIDTLNTELTETFLDNVFVGFTEMGEQFATVAEAAGQLADGTHELANGLGEVNGGVTELTDGLAELNSNSGTLSSGVGQYTSGVVSLSEGLQQLQSGTAGLPGQVGQLSAGMNQTAEGAGQLATGAEELAGGAGQLGEGVAQTGSGATELAAGVGQFAAGVEQTGQGASELATGAAGLYQGLQQYQQQTPGQVAQAITCEVAQIPEGPACDAFLAGVQQGAAAAVAGLSAEQNGSSLLSGAEGLATGAAGLAAGINGTQGQPGLVQGAEGLATGANQLAAGINGTTEQPGLAQGAAQLAGGATELAGGAKELAAGTEQLAGGTAQLAGGMGQLSEGIAAAASGAQQLAASGPELASGVEQYTEGVGAVATGTSALAEGLTALEEGAVQLDDGTRQLADGLAEGAGSVPSYSTTEREQLTTVATRPVATGTDSGPVAFADPTTLGSIIGIALWLGALLGSALLGTGAARAWRSSASSGRLLLRSLLPLAAITGGQGVLFGAVAGVLTGQEAAGVAKLILVGAVAGLSFAALNQGLALLLGRVGRFLAVLIGILAVATSLVSARPTLLAGTRPILPTTPTIDAIIAVTRPTPGFGWALATLVGWLVIGVAFTAVGIQRHRQVKVSLAPVPGGPVAV